LIALATASRKVVNPLIDGSQDNLKIIYHNTAIYYYSSTMAIDDVATGEKKVEAMDDGPQDVIVANQKDLEDIPDIDHVAEAILVRKLDRYIVPPVMLLYLVSFLDRVNIGNARLYGMEKDLGLHGMLVAVIPILCH
jgi:hypothetical protein